MPVWCAVDPGFAKEDESTIYCTPIRHANSCTTEVIYHTHDLLHCSGGKYTNRYNTKEDEPRIYCTPNRHANRYTTDEI
jgi:collagenase-like PrtC family protease